MSDREGNMWAALISLLGPLLLQKLGLFGGTDDTTTQENTGTTTTTALPTGYQSPTLGLLDLLMQGTLGQNLKTYSNWGLPAGKSIAPSYLDDFLGLIGSSYTDLQKKYTNPTPIIPTVPTAEEKAVACRNKCLPYGGVDSLGYTTCYRTCIGGRG
jgi:hypothetical protein